MSNDQHVLFAEPPPKRNWTLSPSEFGFLWQECKRCYYLKVTQKYNRPGIVPGIFTAIDRQTRQFFDRQRTERVAPQLASGVFDCTDQWVQSEPISLLGSDGLCQIRGKIDAFIRFDDGTFAVVDFKTTANTSSKVDTYSRQLNAYAYALENAAAGKLTLNPVRVLGLLIFEPRNFTSAQDAAKLSGSFTWVPIPRDTDAFLNYLIEVAAVLNSSEAPPPDPACSWCKYREHGRTSGY